MSYNFLTALTVVSACISTIATCIMAFYTKQTRDIYKRTVASQDQFQGQLSDLYQAIVIATMQSANSAPDVLPSFITEFKKYYKGKTKIF